MIFGIARHHNSKHSSLCRCAEAQERVEEGGRSRVAWATP